jgi:hypothetical protein
LSEGAPSVVDRGSPREGFWPSRGLFCRRAWAQRGDKHDHEGKSSYARDFLS